MATTVITKLNVTARCTESVTGVGAGDKTQVNPNIIELVKTYATGTSANQQDLVYSTTDTQTGAQTWNLDALTSEATGAAVAFANISGFIVQNNSTTAAETITIGAGSNPWITWLNATGDAVVIGPGGVFVWTSPVDAAAITASTGDILTLTMSASLEFSLLIWGQSA